MTYHRDGNAPGGGVYRRREVEMTHDITDEEAHRRAQTLDQAAPHDTRCAYCHGSGVDPGEPPFDVARPLPETPEEVHEFTSRRYRMMMRAGARRALHLVSALDNGLRSEGARQYDRTELAFVRFGLALLQRYVGELVAERDVKSDDE